MRTILAGLLSVWKRVLEFQIRLCLFCLMTNHVHLVLESQDGKLRKKVVQLEKPLESLQAAQEKPSSDK